MIKEYALDPALLKSWKDLRYFLEAMGVSRGRLISRYPKRWKALVYNGLSDDIGDMERKRIEEALNTINEKFFPRHGGWNHQVSWLENAEAEHAREPFSGILSSDNPRSNPCVLVGDEIGESSETWVATTQIETQRDPKLMAEVVAPLLRNNREILFVDPYFSPTSRRYTSTLAAFLLTATQCGVGLPRVQYLCKANGDSRAFSRNCMKELPRFVPKGLALEIVLLKERPGGEKLHDRFILTDRWGVQFSVGLDSHGPNDATTTIVTLLTEELWSAIYQKYASGHPAFELAGPPIRVIGTA